MIIEKIDLCDVIVSGNFFKFFVFLLFLLRVFMIFGDFFCYCYVLVLFRVYCYFILLFVIRKIGWYIKVI